MLVITESAKEDDMKKMAIRNNDGEVLGFIIKSGEIDFWVYSTDGCFVSRCSSIKEAIASM